MMGWLDSSSAYFMQLCDFRIYEQSASWNSCHKHVGQLKFAIDLIFKNLFSMRYTRSLETPQLKSEKRKTGGQYFRFSGLITWIIAET
jgi:hypothetical protein